MQIKHRYKTEGGLEQIGYRALFECMYVTI